MEEERARQRALQQQHAADGSDATAESQSTGVSNSSAAPVHSAPAPGVATSNTTMTDEDDEESALREALLLSQEDVQMGEAVPASAAGVATGRTQVGVADEEDEDEEAEISERLR